MSKKRQKRMGTPGADPGSSVFPGRNWLSKEILRVIVRDLPINVEFTPLQLWYAMSGDSQKLVEKAYPSKGGGFMVARTMNNMNTTDQLPGLRKDKGSGQVARWVYSPPKGWPDKVPQVVHTTETPKPEVKATPAPPDTWVKAKERTAQERLAAEETGYSAAELNKQRLELLAQVESLESEMEISNIIIEMVDQKHAEMVEAHEHLIQEAIKETEMRVRGELEASGITIDSEKMGIGKVKTYTMVGFFEDETELWRDDQNGLVGEVRFDAL